MVKGKEKNDKQEDDEREKKLEQFGLKSNFQIFIDLVIFPGYLQDIRILSGYKGAFRIQGCLYHMT